MKATVLLAAATLTACSSLATISNTRPIPARHVVADNNGDACVTIIRDHEGAGWRRLAVLVDGLEVARLGADEHMRYCTQPGDRLIEIRDNAALMTKSTDAKQWAARASKISYFRLTNSRLLPTTESSAL